MTTANSESQTREDLVSAGLALFRARGPAAVTLADVARAAGVSRQTVYLHFGNRTGLLTEVARHSDLNSSYARQLREISYGPASVAALETFVRTWFRNLPDILEVVLALHAAAASDAAARAALQNRMDTIATMIGRLIKGLKDQGALQEGWAVGEASDWICFQLDPVLWDHAIAMRGWRPRRFIDRTWKTIESTLLS